MESFFLHLKPVKILVRLSDPSADNYASALSTRVDCTYSHTVRIIQQMEEFGLVRSQKKGRKKEIELTEKGRNAADALSDLLQALKA